MNVTTILGIDLAKRVFQLHGVDENGKVLKAWDGFPDETADQFVAQVSAVVNK